MTLDQRKHWEQAIVRVEDSFRGASGSEQEALSTVLHLAREYVRHMNAVERTYGPPRDWTREVDTQNLHIAQAEMEIMSLKQGLDEVAARVERLEHANRV